MHALCCLVVRRLHTHTNNAGYSNGSSLPVEGLEINDVYVGMLVLIIMRVAAYFSLNDSSCCIYDD